MKAPPEAEGPGAEQGDAPHQEPDHTTVAVPGFADGAAVSLRRGSTLGRYIIVSRIGAGGMGVVYAAYDPELDRKVAVKLLRTGDASGAGGAARARLLREAQALAKLSHPNVIAVYDVGAYGGGIFVAMEFVVGRTLDAWLQEAPRSPQEVVRAFASAGRGLAAAHAAGIVHRDFKPSNVLVGDDGRVRVLDFGLARRSTDVAPAAAERAPGGAAAGDPEAPLPIAALDVSLTETGALLGTPRYMSPEQLGNEDAGPASDQFSFCVALLEALYGEHPFDADNILALARAVQAGDVREPPKGTRVPAWLRRALLRGISSAKEARYPSMDALLAELERDPARARRAWAGAGALGAAVAAGVLALRVLGPAPPPPPCTGAEGRLAGVWDGPRKQAVRAALRGAGPLGDDAGARVAGVLDGYARSWVAMHTDACMATRARGEQSEHLLDLRMQCLERRRKDLSALTDLYIASPKAVLERAVKAAYELGDVGFCAHTQALSQPVPPPADQATRDKVDALTTDLATIKALVDLGRYEDALPKATAAADAARALRYKPIEAETLYALGDIQDRLGDPKAERTLEDAMAAAMAGHDDAWFARAASGLVWVTALVPARRDDAHRYGRLAQAAIDRLGGSDDISGSLANALGTVYQYESNYPKAAEVLGRALDLRTRVYGPDHINVAKSKFNLGNLANVQHRFEEARRYHLEALSQLERALGPDHPDIAQMLNSLGVDEMELGRYDEAAAIHERALSIRERVFGPDHYDVASSLHNLGNTRMRQGKDAEALALCHRSIAILGKTIGEDHYWMAAVRTSAAEVHLRAGRRAEAIAELEKAMAIHKRIASSEVEAAPTAFVLARALWEDGARPRAVELGVRARDAFAASEEYKADLAEVEAWLSAHRAPGP